MEEKFQLRAPLGSKLPKFGTSKPVGSFLAQAQNGGYNGMSVRGPLVGDKHSDHDRTTSLTFSRSKLKYPNNEQISRTSNLGIQRSSPASTMVQNDGHGVGGAKLGKQSNMVVAHKDDLNENVYSGNRFTKGTPFGRTAYSGLNEHKAPMNGFYIAKPPTGLYRPRANSATNRNFGNGVSSSDNKPFSPVRRSQSFSHSVQNPSYPSATLTRSYSLHRDKDLTKVNQLHLLSSRIDQRPRFPKQYGLSNGHEAHLKSMFTRPYSTGFTAALRKPVPANAPPAAPASIGYKMTRPSLLKSRSLEISDIIKDSSVAPQKHNTESLSNGMCHGTDTPEKVEDKDLDIFSPGDNLEPQDFKDSYFSEDVDELSISSLSSSDKNDFSEDFSDDFLDLEEKPEKTFPKSPSQYSLGGAKEEEQNHSKKCEEWIDLNMKDLKDGDKKRIVLQAEKSTGEEQSVYPSGTPQAKTPCGSNNSDDWLDIDIAVQNEADPKSHPYEENAISPDMDYRDPSSLELSPSDSSDGTYMWDEEGMEPIGNIHQCESYESSEMNSLDILNNIETCDLEEDDLMLDVEIPEDPPCDLGDGESMSRFDRSERNLRQQQLFWKRNPPRLNGQEQYHLSNPEHYPNGRGSSCLESPSDKKDSYGSPYCSPLSPRSPQMLGLHENTVMLDEMTLRHMVQDCTNVKTQLLKIKRLLQQEDDPESPVTDFVVFPPALEKVEAAPEKVEAETPLKTEDLLREIAQLKEESRKKDETIKQLNDKLKTRCKCQKEEPKVEKPRQHEKFTQTNWRRSSSGYSAPSFSPWQGSYQGSPRTGPPHRRQTSHTTVFQQLPQFHRPPAGKISGTPTYRGPK